MSILIRGMEMPVGCTLCPIRSRRFCYAAKAFIEKPPVIGRHERCPLVELPAQHGRLIDADALKAVVCEALKKALDNDSVNLFGAVLAEFVARGFTDEIENAPTIIEAEVSE